MPPLVELFHEITSICIICRSTTGKFEHLQRNLLSLPYLQFRSCDRPQVLLLEADTVNFWASVLGVIFNGFILRRLWDGRNAIGVFSFILYFSFIIQQRFRADGILIPKLQQALPVSYNMKVQFIAILVFMSAQIFGQIVPKGYEPIVEKKGDLNKDGIDEKVIVYNTGDTTEDGIIRELRIYKKSNREWKLWKKSRNAIKKSQEGGMMGDPFGSIEIENGILLIAFNGGSSWKWNYTDKYRYQNGEFELIGYHGIYRKLCEYWIDVDFNLVTGKVIYNKEFEDCAKGQEVYKKENETFIQKGISLNIFNRNIKEVKLVSPKYKNEYYL